MARPPKPSVRYYLPKERIEQKDPHVQLRGVASYNRKRLSFKINLLSPEEVWLVFVAINPHGEYVPHHTVADADEKAAIKLSNHLTEVRGFLLRLIERAVESGVWDNMNSRDLRDFIGYHTLSRDKAVFCKGGIFDKWASKEGRNDGGR
ncbi:MAG: hypothetical protein K2J63_04850 [Muribaculaceae bacterium]|nr:hypothetical protein [Muribaculaceae bacterium]